MDLSERLEHLSSLDQIHCFDNLSNKYKIRFNSKISQVISDLYIESINLTVGGQSSNLSQEDSLPFLLLNEDDIRSALESKILDLSDSVSYYKSNLIPLFGKNILNLESEKNNFLCTFELILYDEKKSHQFQMIRIVVIKD